MINHQAAGKMLAAFFWIWGGFLQKMNDFLTALCLVLVIEGLIYVMFASAFKRYALQLLQMPEATLRTGGMIAIAVGVFGVWLLRG